MHVILAQPRGFCAGAVRAIKMVESALADYGRPVYVLHEIVHNPHVVGDLRRKGAVFVERLECVPDGSVIIFSAHGVSTAVVRSAEKKELRIIDATCPLISKIHSQARRLSQLGFEIILIGHPGHPEIEGTLGCLEGPAHVLSSMEEVADLKVGSPDRLACITQTTLSFEDTVQIINALKGRFRLQGAGLTNICYATQARQKSVKILSGSVDLILVIGAYNSSNSNRLREIGALCGLPSYLVEDTNGLESGWFSADSRVGITAGASTPETMVQKVLEQLSAFYPCTVSEMAGASPESFARGRSGAADLKESSRI